MAVHRPARPKVKKAAKPKVPRAKVPKVAKAKTHVPKPARKAAHIRTLP